MLKGVAVIGYGTFVKLTRVIQRLRGGRRGEINFVARRDNLHTMQTWLPDWAPGLAVNIFDYETLPPPRRLPPGLWIFADVDRLTPEGLPVAVAAWQGLMTRYGRRVRLLNRPGGSMPRRMLLDRLYETGRNGFKVYDARDWRAVARFPVFLRLGQEHYGALSPLLHDRDALRDGIEAVRAQGYPFDDLLVVEFLDTSVDGVFRKFSVFRVGALFLAQHAFHAPDWCVKESLLKDVPAHAEEDRLYRHGNPQLSAVREVFDLAGIDYGRIDYAMLAGRVQTWEINSNPTIMYRPSDYAAAQMPAKREFAATLVETLRTMAQATST